MFKSRLLNRRQALRIGLGTLASLTACNQNQLINQKIQGQSVTESATNAIAFGEIGLSEIAAAKGIIYGAAAKKTELKDEKFASSFLANCQMVIPKWEFRWNWLNPEPGIFEFTKTDPFVQWAKTNNLLLRGHTLIYQRSMPKWFLSQVNRQNVEKMFLDYTNTVVGHYAGQLHSWDVVNETVFPSDGNADGLRNISWLKWLGLDFFDIVFRAAAEADPQALLVLNDNRMDSNTENGDAKRVAMLKLLEKLKSRGTPIQALGMQAHIWARDNEPLNQNKIRAFVKEVADLGLKIIVTELDVKDRQLPQDIKIRDRLVAQAYEDYLSAVLDEPAVIAVNTWGLSDRYTWLAHPKRGARDDGAAIRPLPLDEQFNRKPAWYAIAKAFKNAPKR